MSRTRGNLQLWKKWIYVVVTSLSVLLLVYRIADWVIIGRLVLKEPCQLSPEAQSLKPQSMWTNILPTVHSSRTTAGSNTRDCAPLLILCNVNPIRGSKLFLLPNGDKLYDEYIRNYSLAAPFLPSLLSQIAETEIRKISHQLQDMLKSCRSGEGECHSSDFLFTRQGTMACYTMQLNETADQRLQLVLDPQEYDYLLPNDGFVGFMTAVVTSQSVHQLTESHYVSLGSRFHSFVDVRYSWNENCVKPKETLQTGDEVSALTKRRLGAAIKLTYNAAELILVEENCRVPTTQRCPAYYVRSVTQTSKLPMFIKPVNVGHGETISRNSTEVHFASTVQKRAYLRTNNHTALKMLTQIALELAEAIRDASNVTNFLHQLRIHLSENLHRMDYLMMINVTAPTVSEHLRKKECLSQTRNALSQFDNDPLIPGSFPNGFLLSSPLAMSRKELELYLIDCFYDAQTVTFPSAAFLRKTLKAVMKLHLQFSNVTETGHVSEAMEQARFSNGPSESGCRKLTADYAQLLEQVGSRASAALSKMENVNNGLHGVIRDNRILRAAYSELAGTLPQTLGSSLVTTTLRISKEVRPVDKAFSVFAFGLMRSKRVLRGFGACISDPFYITVGISTKYYH
ncbi:unnamed protein product [Calicophoron daubneyi]|uniref:Uncharacterized protein n=1 Tax=Calicophoron daubneyi TaxID=300641 RepID=A0AAV2TJY6_CALDB